MIHDVNVSHVVFNYTMTGFVVVLIIILIALAMQVINLIKNANVTVASLNVTKVELDATIKRVNTMLEMEVTPTIQVLRQTIANVETTTKAVADTTAIARSFAERAAPYANKIPVAARIAVPSNPISNFGMKIASTLLTALGTRVLAGLGDALSRKKSAPNRPASPRGGNEKSPSLPPPHTGQELVVVEASRKKGLFSRSGKK